MTAADGSSTKRISPNAYATLRRALPTVFWYKRPFESFLRDALASHPELLVGLNFQELKREVAHELVNRLSRSETKYQALTLQLMLEIASMQRFPDLERLEDSTERIAEAERVVKELRDWTDRYVGRIQEAERFAAEQAATLQQNAAFRKFAEEIENLHLEFIRMHTMVDSHARGHDFEAFLSKLFAVFDMEPRLKYSLEREQIDGSLSFDTDDYVVEAKWWSKAVGRDEADIFAAKVRRKGKNALGLFVSESGFTRTALDEYAQGTPFLAVDGADLMCVLEQRVRLDDLLKRKKRHANETGHCYFPASNCLQ